MFSGAQGSGVAVGAGVTVTLLVFVGLGVLVGFGSDDPQAEIMIATIKDSIKRKNNRFFILCPIEKYTMVYKTIFYIVTSSRGSKSCGAITISLLSRKRY